MSAKVAVLRVVILLAMYAATALFAVILERRRRAYFGCYVQGLRNAATQRNLAAAMDEVACSCTWWRTTSTARGVR